jgi:DNA-directed RNA polymerase subunit L
MISSAKNGGHTVEIENTDYTLINWLCYSKIWKEMINFFNKMSTFMFEIGVELNGE